MSISITSECAGICRVLAKRSGHWQVIATGWRWDDAHVFTAGHIASASDASFAVQFGADTEIRAALLPSDHTLDFAVLRLERAPGAKIPCLNRVDAMGDYRQADPWTCWGFPEMQPVGLTLSGELLGEVEADDTVWVELDCGSHRFRAPEESVDGRDVINGMSGAPVFDECGRIIGVFIAHATGVGGLAYAVPMYLIVLRLPATLRATAVSAGPLAEYLRSRATAPNEALQFAADWFGQTPQQVWIGRHVRCTHSVMRTARGPKSAAEKKFPAVPLPFDNWCRLIAASAGGHLLVGEAGSGKSALAYELDRYLATSSVDAAPAPLPILLHSEALAAIDVEEFLRRPAALLDHRATWARHKLALVVDGLDELDDPLIRSSCLEKLVLLRREAEQRGFALTLVLALRPDGEVESRLADEGFSIWHLQLLSVMQCAELVLRLSGSNALLAERVTAVLTGTLLRTPLVLTLATAALERIGADRVGLDEFSLLGEAVDALLQRAFDSDAQAQDEMPGPPSLRTQFLRDPLRYAEAALEYLAADTLTVSRPASLMELSRTWAAQIGAPRAGPASALPLFKWVLARTGLVSFAADRTQRWSHGVFRDAFIARRLVREQGSSAYEMELAVAQYTSANLSNAVALALVGWLQDDNDAAVWAGQQLLRIAGASPRGLELAVRVLEAGGRLDSDQEQQIYNLVLARLAAWNPCSELFHTYKSRPPHLSVRALARRPSFMLTLDACFSRWYELGSLDGLELVVDSVLDCPDPLSIVRTWPRTGNKLLRAGAAILEFRCERATPSAVDTVFDVLRYEGANENARLGLARMLGELAAGPLFRRLIGDNRVPDALKVAAVLQRMQCGGSLEDLPTDAIAAWIVQGLEVGTDVVCEPQRVVVDLWMLLAQQTGVVLPRELLPWTVERLAEIHRTAALPARFLQALAPTAKVPDTFDLSVPRSDLVHELRLLELFGSEAQVAAVHSDVESGRVSSPHAKREAILMLARRGRAAPLLFYTCHESRGGSDLAVELDTLRRFAPEEVPALETQLQQLALASVRVGAGLLWRPNNITTQAELARRCLRSWAAQGLSEKSYEYNRALELLCAAGDDEFLYECATDPAFEPLHGTAIQCLDQLGATHRLAGVAHAGTTRLVERIRAGQGLEQAGLYSIAAGCLQQIAHDISVDGETHDTESLVANALASERVRLDDLLILIGNFSIEHVPEHVLLAAMKRHDGLRFHSRIYSALDRPDLVLRAQREAGGRGASVGELQAMGYMLVERGYLGAALELATELLQLRGTSMNESWSAGYDWSARIEAIAKRELAERPHFGSTSFVWRIANACHIDIDSVAAFLAAPWPAREEDERDNWPEECYVVARHEALVRLIDRHEFAVAAPETERESWRKGIIDSFEELLPRIARIEQVQLGDVIGSIKQQQWPDVIQAMQEVLLGIAQDPDARLMSRLHAASFVCDQDPALVAAVGDCFRTGMEAEDVYTKIYSAWCLSDYADDTAAREFLQALATDANAKDWDRINAVRWLMAVHRYEEAMSALKNIHLTSASAEARKQCAELYGVAHCAVHWKQEQPDATA